MRIKVLLLFIILFAFLLRIWKINQNPPSLNWDEVSHGYNAYSILKTGRDEWSERFPLIFRCFGDYKLPLYIYFSIIPVAILGLNPMVVRLISIISGVGLVIVAYLIGEKMTKNQLVGLLGAFLTALSPWSLFLSRVAIEANLAAFLFALGSWFLISGKYYIAVILWGLTLHTYNSARVLVPLMILLLGWQLLRKREIIKLVLILGIFLLFFIPVLTQFLGRSGKARFLWVSPIDQGVINRINEARVSSLLPAPLSRIIHNKVTYFVIYFVSNYFRHFSPSFLFFEGGRHYQFSMPDHGLIYLVTAPFLVLGLLTNRNWFLTTWFFSSFIPSAITRDSPHVLRSILVLPLPMVFTSLGVQKMDNWLKKKSIFCSRLVVLGFEIGVFLSFGLWWRSYWQDYRIGYSWAWQYGYKEVVEYAKENYGKYDKIFVTKRYGEPHEFFLFFWPWDPHEYRTDPNLIRYFKSDWYWVDSFDKFVFINDWEIKEKTIPYTLYPKPYLLVTSPDNYPEGWRKLEVVNFLDGKPAFEILEL